MAYFIEKGTNYAYRLQYLENLNFQEVRDLSVRIISYLPEVVINQLHRELDHGTGLLKEEIGLSMYMYAYGKMHYAKLEQAFLYLPEWFDCGLDIEVIDYACGQGLGVIAFADYCKRTGIPLSQVKRLTLIDLSSVCLKRAALHASAFFPGIEINTVKKCLNKLSTRDIKNRTDRVKIHIFSNILDMESIHLKSLAQYLLKRFSGMNYFVCVGPYYGETSKSMRITTFSDYFTSTKKGNSICCLELDKGEFRGWSCQILLFCYMQIRTEVMRRIVRLHDEVALGDKGAQLELASWYEKIQYYERAFNLYMKLAEQGNPEAQYQLGNLYLSGDGVEFDWDEALAWYRSAADQGYEKAISLLEDLNLYLNEPNRGFRSF